MGAHIVHRLPVEIRDNLLLCLLARLSGLGFVLRIARLSFAWVRGTSSGHVDYEDRRGGGNGDEGKGNK